MSSGYADGVDIDAMFEPYQAGDPLAPDTGYQSGGVDVKNRFAAVSAGDRIPSNIIYSAAGTNFRDIFAARLSVPRFPNPLPWARTDTISASVYRHTSRAHTLNVYLQARISIGQDGGYFIQRYTPPYNSDPNNVSAPIIVSAAAGTLWPAGQMNDFEVLFEHVSGITPTLNNGTPFGVWVSAASVAERSIFARMDVNHSSAPATYTNQSSFRIHVRRVQYPATNRANAVYTVNFALTMEQPSLQDNSWNGTFTSNQADPGIRHTPEGGGNNWAASTRIVFDTDGTWYVQTATSGGWVTQRSGRWLRAAFSTAADYEVIMTNPDGSISGGAGVWHNLGSSRVFQVNRVVNTNSAPGTYTTTGNATFRIREISTRNWAGIVDNFIENSITMSASVTINTPIMLLEPVAGFTMWAGTYNVGATVQVGPPPAPPNAINPSGWGGTVASNFTKARTVAAPTNVTIQSRLIVTTNTSGQLVLARSQYYGVFNGSTFSGDPDNGDTSVTTQQIINTGIGPVSDYELRFVHVSGNVVSSSLGDGAWRSFGDNPITALGGWGHGDASVVSTNTFSASTSSVYRIEVRHKYFPSEVSRSNNITLSTSRTLTGFVSGGSGGGGGGGGDDGNPRPPEIEN